MGPDERVYSVHAGAVEMFGVRGLRIQAGVYLDPRSGLRDYPSPIRWLWACIVRALPRPGLFGFALLAFLSRVVSPLALAQSRTLLQDGTVAAATVGAVLAARAHAWPQLVLATFLGMCLKPEAMLGIAAGALAASADVRCAWALTAGAVAWYVATGLVFGGGLASRLMRSLAQRHEHQYGRTHQRGLPHRLLVDLCMIAPFAVVCGPWPKEAIAIVAVHAASPVRNVRTIIAAEVLLRMAFVHAAPWWLVVASMLYDLILWRKLSKVYDPVTDELRKAVC